MLTEDTKDSTLYKEISMLIEPLSLKLVEVSDAVSQGTHHMRVILFKESEEVSTEDLAKVYNIVYPRYSVIFSDRDLELEVSSPGLQRNFKDTLEFELFKGKLVRVYSVSNSSYITGRILSADDSSVTLSDAEIENTGEGSEMIKISFSDISKAKLEYRWEAQNA